jgi:CheY-like chemotaxis protein
MPTRILIADDSPAVRTALRKLLEGAAPWEITDASNGEEAIAKAQELKPDLIVLDLVMPTMDGLTAARELSKLLPQVPLILHTLHSSPQVDLEAQKVGIRQVVPKAESHTLIEAIKKILDARPVVAPPTPIAQAAAEANPGVEPPPPSSLPPD